MSRQVSEEETLQQAREVFLQRLILNIWRPVLWVLAASDISGSLCILLGPPTSKNSVVFKLLSAIDLSNTIVALILMLSGVLLLFRSTMTVGHFLSAVSNGWWSVIIIYIALFLGQSTSLIAASWTGALALIHLIAGGGRIVAHRFDKKMAKLVREESSE